ncbi:hypothetical protein B0H11DRAFT_1920943 [Mycena galericulata]|nr:hypothetical protein B0H11DRAFT_1920943 [Mycena galericulata]
MAGPLASQASCGSTCIATGAGAGVVVYMVGGGLGFVFGAADGVGMMGFRFGAYCWCVVPVPACIERARPVPAAAVRALPYLADGTSHQIAYSKVISEAMRDLWIKGRGRDSDLFREILSKETNSNGLQKNTHRKIMRLGSQPST